MTPSVNKLKEREVMPELSKELDEILDSIPEWDDAIQGYQISDDRLLNARTALLKLIETREVAARVDELNSFYGRLQYLRYFVASRSPLEKLFDIERKTIKDRLAQLKSKQGSK